MELDYVALGKRLRTRRKEMGMKQQTLAEIVGVEPSNISHIERAVSKVSLGTLVKIANVLECTINDLLCDSLLYERQSFECELMEITKDCSAEELRIITDLAVALKESLQKRNRK